MPRRSLVCVFAAALPFLLIAAPARAIGLGAVQVLSSLGAPFHAVIPVNAASIDDVGCVSIQPASDLPGPANARVKVTSLPSGAVVIDVSSPAGVSEPAMGFTVAAGCNASISRAYVVFLDPPVLAPELATDAAGPALTAATSAPLSAGRSARRRASRGSSSAAPGSNRASAQARVVPAYQAPALAVPPRRLPAARRALAAPAPVTPLAAAPDVGAGDRFHLSSELGTDLRMADQLGTGDAQPIDAQQLQALKDERARLIQLLAGQPLAATPSAKEIELQQRVNQLTNDTTTLRQQLQTIEQRSKQLEQRQASSYLTWVFALVALVALGVAGWFGYRHRRGQLEHADQPWWEQSQLANITERGGEGAITPFGAAPRLDVAADPVEPELVDHETFLQSRAGAAPGASLRANTTPAPMPLKPLEPTTVARAGPPTMPMSTPAVVPVPAAAAPLVSPLVSPLSPPPAAPSSYGSARTDNGSLDERIDSAVPSPLDFNLDLPAVTTNLGRDHKGVAGPGDQRPTELAPIDFDLPAGLSGSAPAPPPMGPDTILRLDEPAIAGAEAPLLAGAAESASEQASVQFRLVQFASVVEQAEELQRLAEPTKAIATLRQYVLRDETIPTLMWLMLFALYKQVNKRPVYDALGEHFSRRYKRPMARWDESLQSIAPQTALAHLPELDAAIRAQWGSQAGIEMLRSLTCGRDQPDEIIFNAVLQHDLLQLAKVFPLNDSV